MNFTEIRGRKFDAWTTDELTQLMAELAKGASNYKTGSPQTRAAAFDELGNVALWVLWKYWPHFRPDNFETVIGKEAA